MTVEVAGPGTGPAAWGGAAASLISFIGRKRAWSGQRCRTGADDCRGIMAAHVDRSGRKIGPVVGRPCASPPLAGTPPAHGNGTGRRPVPHRQCPRSPERCTDPLPRRSLYGRRCRGAACFMRRGAGDSRHGYLIPKRPGTRPAGGELLPRGAGDRKNALPCRHGRGRRLSRGSRALSILPGVQSALHPHQRRQ